MAFIITITSVTEVSDNIGGQTEHYRRRVEMLDVAQVIQRLDSALNQPVRKPRSDKGTSRNKPEASKE